MRSGDISMPTRNQRPPFLQDDTMQLDSRLVNIELDPGRACDQFRSEMGQTPAPGHDSPAGFFHNLPTGGAIRVASQQLAHLSGSVRWSVHVPEGSARFSPDPGLPARLWPFPEGAPVRGAARLAAPLLLWRKAFAFEALCRRIASAMEEEGCRCALIHPSTIVSAPHLLRFLRVPTLYYCHEYPRYLYEEGMLKTPNRMFELLMAPLLAMEKQQDRVNARSSTILVSNSEYMAPRLREIYGREPVVVRPGVDTGLFYPSGAGGDGCVLSVGAISPFKGHDLAIRALGLIEERRRPPLVIVGDRSTGGYAGRLTRLAAASGVDVRLRVGIGVDELIALYRSASVVVCGQRREPFGLVLLEAMACGRPVVAVSEGGFAENVEDGSTGLLVARDPGAMADAVSRLLADPALAARMGSAARRFVERERTVESMTAAMKQLLDGIRSA
jgi:glycosyltransferase involved in cell wall biosynthesis